MNVWFHYEGISNKIPFSKKHIKLWIMQIAKSEKVIFGEINYIFCSDEFLLNLNLKYLNHDTLTDIITFDNSDNSNKITGDVFISIERVNENASNLNIDFKSELLRVMSHGILHLCGYKDKNSNDKLIMKQKEDAAIALFTIV
ncbi:MAG: rRNA maturation RNase YbeY [Bacteroidota bacterium]|nr:rRNA maturation RNase YbeY [Bacteroidota bacterium]